MEALRIAVVTYIRRSPLPVWLLAERFCLRPEVVHGIRHPRMN